jgi:hypothetical protein
MKLSFPILLSLAAPFVVLGSPFFDLNIGGDITIPRIVEALGVANNDYIIKYESSSRPGPGFFDYMDALDVSYNKEVDRSMLVEVNSSKRIEELRFNLRAFHLCSKEEVNGVVLNKERILSEGLLVDYFPDVPTAHLRQPGFSRDKITLFDVLSQLPSNPSTVRNDFKPDGWSTYDTFAGDIIKNGDLQITDHGFVLSFLHQFQDLKEHGFRYQFHFNKGAVLGSYRLSMLKVDIAHFREELGVWEVGEPFYHVLFNDYSSGPFPSEIKVDMWRGHRAEASEPVELYLVRQLAFNLDSFATAPLGDEGFSFHFDEGTTVMDELTGTRYRVGNPIDKLIREVSGTEGGDE